MFVIQRLSVNGYSSFLSYTLKDVKKATEESYKYFSL